MAAGAVASIAGNALATDLHDLITRRKLDSLANHHLQQLSGRALSVLIQCYEKEIDPPKTVEKWVPLLRRGDETLSAVARAAEAYWDKVDLAPESESLADEEIHLAFLERDRTDSSVLVSAEVWDQHLAQVALWAQTKSGSAVWLREADRQALAAYVAPRFELAVRELVKADFDPSIGTGGCVFVGLHLDMMRAISLSVQRLDIRTDKIEASRQFIALKKISRRCWACL